MIRRTHHFLHWILGVFIVYLLVTRLIISWIQFFPQQFVDVTKLLTGIDFQAKEIEIDQDWLGFQFELKDFSIESPKFVFQAEYLRADINTFAILVPTIGYGDFLKVSQGAFQEKALKPKESDDRPLKLEELLKIDANISSLWKRVQLKEFVLSEVVRPELIIQVHDFQSINASRLSVVSEFSLSYKEILKYERFNLNSSFTPDIWGDVVSGDFSISSFSPLEIKRLSKLLSTTWQSVLPDGELLIDLQGRIQQSRLADMVLNLNGQALIWRQKERDLPASVGLQLNWNSQNQDAQKRFKDWLFTLSKIQINNRYIESVSPMKLYFDGEKYLHFNAEYFELEPFQVLVKALIKTPHVAAFFDKTAYLSTENLIGKIHWETLDVPELAINFKRLDVPVTRYPGVSVRNLQLDKTATGMTLSTDRPVWVMAPEVHAIPMQVKLPKRLEWFYSAETKSWRLPESAVNIDGMGLNVKVIEAASGYLDTDFSLKADGLKKLKQYLPYQFMSEELQSWLKAALVDSGSVAISGKVKGKLDEFPFENQQGLFELRAKVKNGVLKFDPNWPELRKLNADFKFKPYLLDIDVGSVDLGTGVIAKNIDIQIPDLASGDVALTVRGRVNSSLKQAAVYIENSPLAKQIGLDAFLESGGELSGRANIVLDRIWIPIAGYEKREEEVDGKVIFNNSQLKLHEKLVLNKLHGALTFSESEVRANNLEFTLFGGKAQAKVKTDKKSNHVLIDMQGQLLTKTNDWFTKSVPWKSSISLPFKSSATNNKQLLLETSFDLDAAQSKLPAPFTKQALVNKSLMVTTVVDQGLLSSKVSLPGLLDSNLSWLKVGGEYELSELQLNLGDASFVSRANEASYIRGTVAKVDIDGWLPVLREIEMTGENSISLENLTWSESRINVDTTHFLAKDYPQLKLRWLTEKHEPFKLIVRSEDISGSVTFKSKDLIQVDLSKLQIYTDAKKAQEEVYSTELCVDQEANKNKLPTIDFNVRDLFIDQRKIDSLSFVLVDELNRLRLKQLKGSISQGKGYITGDYLLDKQTRKSKLKLNINATSVAAVTKVIGVNEGFTGKVAEAVVDLNWDGGLECFSTRMAKGKVSFIFKDGSIEDVEPGIARLIGLLSIESLVRRLQLDLKDVTNKGMVYDEIKGAAELQQGKLALSLLELKAPSALGNMTGEVDLVDEQFNLNAEMTPKIGATVPTIAALAGSTNPIAALAVYTLMKVLPGVNENLITYKYRITGNWDQPNIEELNKPKQKPENDTSNDNGVFEFQ